MGVQIKTGELNSPTATGNQSYTGVGFVPVAIIFFANREAAGSAGVPYVKNIGFTSGSTAAQNTATSFHDRDNIATSDPNYNQSIIACVLQAVLNSNSVGIKATLVSFDSDGFTLNWTTVEASARPVQYIAIGGTNVSAKVGSLNAGTGTGNLSVTGIGFQPKLVLFHGIVRSAQVDAGYGNTISLIPSFGAAVDASNQWGEGGFITDASNPAQTESVFSTSSCLLTTNGGGSVNVEFAFVSQDADGFTIDPITAYSLSPYLHYLCLAGSDFNAKVGNETQKTSTGTKATNGVGFTPNGLILAGSGDSTATRTVVPSVNSFLGGASATSDRRVAAQSSTDNISPSETGAATSAANVLEFVAGNTPSVVASADLSSFDVDGFTLNYGAADATARMFGYVAFAGSLGQPYRKRLGGVPFAAGGQLGVY